MRRRWTIGDFHDAYRSGHTSPEDVAKRILQCIADSESIDPPMRLFIASDAADIRRQAAAAAQRQAPLPRTHNNRIVTEVSSAWTCSCPACIANCQHAGLSLTAVRCQSLHGVHGFGVYMAHPVLARSLNHIQHLPSLLLASSTWLKSHLLPVRRFREGRPLSLLDGVPYSVIDGLDALPYRTTAGTTFVRALVSFCSVMQPCTKPGKRVTCIA